MMAEECAVCRLWIDKIDGPQAGQQQSPATDGKYHALIKRENEQNAGRCLTTYTTTAACGLTWVETIDSSD